MLGRTITSIALLASALTASAAPTQSLDARQITLLTLASMYGADGEFDYTFAVQQNGSVIYTNNNTPVSKIVIDHGTCDFHDSDGNEYNVASDSSATVIVNPPKAIVDGQCVLPPGGA